MSEEIASDVKPDATSFIEKKNLYLEALSGNQQTRSEQKPSDLLLRAKMATALNI